MTDLDQPATDIETLKSRHEANTSPSVDQSDILVTAQLFNAVGGELTKVEKHNVDGRVGAMNLDKDKVFSHRPIDDSVYNKSHTPATPIMPSMPENVHVAPQPGPPPPALRETTITVGVKEYEQQKKSLSTIKRKLSKLEKQFVELSDIISHTHKQCSYTVVSDSVEFKCSNTTTLLKFLATELQSSPTSVTISKC